MAGLCATKSHAGGDLLIKEDEINHADKVNYATTVPRMQEKHANRLRTNITNESLAFKHSMFYGGGGKS